jgi:hypothetical protein
MATRTVTSVDPTQDGAMPGNGKMKDVVQVKNPRTGRYVKIDRDQGKIIDHKKSEGPYKGVPIARKRAGK